MELPVRSRQAPDVREDIEPEQRTTLSVVVATFNGARTIGRALDALSSQDHDVALEVIVVNDGSVDETGAIATRPDVTLINLSPNKGKGHALNVGIAAAHGEFFATMDDDCVPPENWVRALVEAWSSVDDQVMMIGGPIVPFATDTFNRRYVDWRVPLHPQEAELHDRAGLWTRVRSALFNVEPPEGARTVYFVVGANMSIRTAAAREIGGFEEAPGIGGDEESIALRLRSRYGNDTVRFLPRVVMYHDFDPSISDTLRRARTYGRANGRSWAIEHDLPSVRPIPAVLVVASVATASLVGSLGLLVLGLLPPLAYRGWWSQLRTSRRLEALTYPYVRVIEDVADNVGFLRGAIAETRRRRGAPR
jgi:glycosyltransferase involved in cell wall biosynthesis